MGYAFHPDIRGGFTGLLHDGPFENPVEYWSGNSTDERLYIDRNLTSDYVSGLRRRATDTTDREVWDDMPEMVTVLEKNERAELSGQPSIGVLWSDGFACWIYAKDLQEVIDKEWRIPVADQLEEKAEFLYTDPEWYNTNPNSIALLREADDFAPGDKVEATSDLYIGDDLIVTAFTSGTVLTGGENVTVGQDVLVKFDVREDGKTDPIPVHHSLRKKVEVDIQKAQLETPGHMGGWLATQHQLARVLRESGVAGEPIPDEAVQLLRTLVKTVRQNPEFWIPFLHEPDFELLFQHPIDESILEAIGERPDSRDQIMRILYNIAFPLAFVTEENYIADMAEERMIRDRAKSLAVALLSRDSAGKERLPGLRPALETLLQSVQPDWGAGADEYWLYTLEQRGYDQSYRDDIRPEVEDVLNAVA